MSNIYSKNELTFPY